MSGNKQLRRRQPKPLSYARGIFAWIAADVRHHHLHAVGGENLNGIECTPSLGTVDIDVDSTHHRRHFAKALDDGHVANVAGVPNLVTVGKMLGVAVVPQRVGVRQYAYSFHNPAMIILQI